MKKLPDAELEIMTIIWNLNKSVTRFEIEEQLKKDRILSPTTILSFLSRLERKGFLQVKKEGRMNLYIPIISQNEYRKKESRSILKKIYNNSIKNFMNALYDGNTLSEEEIKELEEFIEEKKKEIR